MKKCWTSCRVAYISARLQDGSNLCTTLKWEQWVIGYEWGGGGGKSSSSITLLVGLWNWISRYFRVNLMHPIYTPNCKSLFYKNILYFIIFHYIYLHSFTHFIHSHSLTHTHTHPFLSIYLPPSISCFNGICIVGCGSSTWFVE
jgi:hypothetical protein